MVSIKKLAKLSCAALDWFPADAGLLLSAYSVRSEASQSGGQSIPPLLAVGVDCYSLLSDWVRWYRDLEIATSVKNPRYVDTVSVWPEEYDVPTDGK